MSISSKTHTLSAFVDSKAASNTSYQTFSLIELLSTDNDTDIEFPAYSVLNDYYNDLKKLCVTVSFNEKEYFRFRFKPKILADYLYGNGELSFLILILNDMISPKDFDLKTVKLISRQNLIDALTLIRSAETSFITDYNKFANA